MRPGERPAAELAGALERVPRGERLVLAVDQLEELFAPSVAEDERRAFVDALVDAAWDPERRALDPARAARRLLRAPRARTSSSRTSSARTTSCSGR